MKYFDISTGIHAVFRKGISRTAPGTVRAQWNQHEYSGPAHSDVQLRQVVRLFRELPRSPEYQEIGRQLLRSFNSVASNYRATGRARSKAEFISKLGLVREESDESEHWVQMLSAVGLQNKRLAWLRDEAGQLIAIFAASYKTATKRKDDQV